MPVGIVIYRSIATISTSNHGQNLYMDIFGLTAHTSVASTEAVLPDSRP